MLSQKPRFERSVSHLSNWEYFLDGSWTSYLAAGVAAIFLSWALTGCRWGSRVDNGTKTSVGDSMSGFYSTLPKAMQLCVIKSGSEDPICTNTSTSPEFAPKALKDLMTDPIALIVQNTSTGAANVFSPLATQDPNGQIPSFAVTANFSSRTISRTAQYEPIVFWFDEQCKETDKMILSGALSSKDQGTTVGGFKVSGRMLFKVESYTWLDGACTPSTQAAADCLHDVNLCRQADAVANKQAQDFWKEFYAPYLSSGLITEGEIPTVVTLAYGVVYE